MKKFSIFTVLLFASQVLFAQIRSNRDLIGKWDGKDMQLQFFSDQKVHMIVPGGKLPVASFTADFMKNPIAISITLKDNGQNITYKGNLSFIDNENIRLEYFGDNSSNESFAKGRTVLLKKKH